MIDLRLAVSDQVVGDQPVFIKCREHHDKGRPNLAVYANGLRCFGCGFTMQLRDKDGRDLSKLPGHRDPLAYLLKVEELTPEQTAKYTNESLDRYRTRAAEEASMDPLPKALAGIYNRALNGIRSNRLEWLFERGLTLEIINEFQIGHDGIHFVIPIFDGAGNLVSLRYRIDPVYMPDAKFKYFGMKGRNGLYLYPEHVLSEASDTLYICEGELDAIRMWQQYLPAVTVTNGAGQVEKIPALVKERFPTVTKLIVATDQDEAGEEAAKRTIQVARDLGFFSERLTWIGGKDVTEHLLMKAAA